MRPIERVRDGQRLAVGVVGRGDAVAHGIDHDDGPVERVENRGRDSAHRVLDPDLVAVGVVAVRSGVAQRVGRYGELVHRIIRIERRPGGLAGRGRLLVFREVAIGVINISGHVAQGVGRAGFPVKSSHNYMSWSYCARR